MLIWIKDYPECQLWKNQNALITREESAISERIEGDEQQRRHRKPMFIYLRNICTKNY